MERRRSLRFPLVAAAEIHEKNNGTQLSARISDLSATGCYVDQARLTFYSLLLPFLTFGLKLEILRAV